MSRIKQIRASQVTDSRGNPTVEAEVVLESGISGNARVPSGASTGEREAIELRDEMLRNVYRGKSVNQAIANVNGPIARALQRRDVEDQRGLDMAMLELDNEIGTSTAAAKGERYRSGFKNALGANAILSVSLAAAHAASRELFGKDRLFQYVAQLYGGKGGRVLPVPMMNVINGGAHASNLLRVQEFMIMPVGAKSLLEALYMGSRIFAELRERIAEMPDNSAVGVGDEGGFAPMLSPHGTQEQKVCDALNLILQAIERAKLIPGRDVALAVDIAASEFYREDGLYQFSYGQEPPEVLWSSEQMIDFYKRLIADYPMIRSIEDGLAERDHAGWAMMTECLGRKVQLVGDDLFVTNPTIFADGIKNGEGNAILIKVNQVGTLTETLETMRLAEDNGYACVVSHRSGETLDTTIADLAVGCETGQIKTGSMSRGERTAKYNRLKNIEALFLGKGALYPGAGIFARYSDE